MQNSRARISELEAEVKQLCHQIKLLELENDRRLTEQSLKHMNQSFVNEENVSDVGMTTSDSSNVVQDDEEHPDTIIPATRSVHSLDRVNDKRTTPDDARCEEVVSSWCLDEDSLNNAHLDISCPHT